MTEDTRPSDTALVPRQQSGALALFASARPETAKALAQAIKACRAVEKTSTNDFHKYKYASADAIIDVGRDALASSGLCLIPVESTVNGFEREGPDRFELVRVFALLHSSGESTPIRVCWPITPEKGRPLDKATAIADTLSLSYLLRDLLLMNRIDPSDDLGTRDDRKAERPRQWNKQVTDGAELFAREEAREKRLVREKRCQPGELLAYLRKQASLLGESGDMANWSAETIRHASDWIRTFLAARPEQPQAKGLPPTTLQGPRPTSPEKAKQLQELLFAKRIPWTGRFSMCEYLKVPETTMIEDLTPAQYAEAVKVANEVPS
jgi:hypothetical protein